MWNGKEPTRLNDVFPEWLTGGGIFSVLQSFPVPWRTESISGALDIEYHGNVSGDKIISPLVEKVKVGDTLTDLEKTVIATSIFAVCGLNWEKQWETLSFEYNPIENYRMTETMTDDETVTEYGKSTTRTDNLTHRKTGTETGDIDETDTRTDNLTHGKTGLETRTDNLSDTTTPNLTTNTSNTVHGFNSSVGVSSDEQTGTQTGTNTVTHTGTEQKQYNLSETDSGTEQKQYNLSETETGTQTTVRDGTNETTFNTTDTDTGTQSTLDGGSDTQTRNYELTRSGNIGVTTSQQMVESERTLWMWNFFRNVVFPDLDQVLTLPIY